MIVRTESEETASAAPDSDGLGIEVDAMIRLDSTDIAAEEETDRGGSVEERAAVGEGAVADDERSAGGPVEGETPDALELGDGAVDSDGVGIEVDAIEAVVDESCTLGPVKSGVLVPDAEVEGSDD